MGYLEIIFIGIGLSMDACAVSMSNGMCFKQMNFRHVLETALAFGIFQGIMPCIGYFAGSILASQINAIDHWIALILLGFIGGKMIYDALRSSDEDEITGKQRFTFRLLMLQSIATSIDALAVGVSFAALTVNIVVASSIIALCTFVLSLVSVYIGKKFGTLLNQKAELIGGIILVFIGLKIFVEHMFQI